VRSPETRVPKTVLLKGYYGFGNFGDDLLLISIERIVRALYPEALISVFSNYNERLPGFSRFHGYQEYLRALLSGPVQIVDWSTKGHFDLIVHGGGGVFFVPDNEAPIPRPFGRLAHRLGPRAFAGLARILRRLVARRRRQTARRTVAIGVGLGSYRDTSQRSLADLEELGRLDRIAVRDIESLSVARSMGLGDRVGAFTDLAFALEPSCAEKRVGDIPHVGFIMCEGKPFNGMMRTMMEQPGPWRASPIMLDENHDKTLIDQLDRAEIRQLVWRPNELRIEEFWRALGAFDLVVTSRAHGAIAAALIETPAIVLDTDSKLRSIHSLLPNGTILVRPKSHAELNAAIEHALAHRERLLQGLRADVAEQRSRIGRMVAFAFN
jgi:polysaccharide pyruvyl transferase WcaK-like protein